MTEAKISLTVNGDDYELTVEPRTLLVTALREEFGYTGANVGCDTARGVPLRKRCSPRLRQRRVRACISNAGILD